MKYKSVCMQELRNEMIDKFMALLSHQKVNRKSTWTNIDGLAINEAADDFKSVLIKIKKLK